jgi:CheY-like chemotaxis protein
MLHGWTPDLVILDLGLPDGDGMSILQLVGARGTMDVPALVVSGESDPDRRVLALELGASDVIAKPFNLLELGVRARRTVRAHDDIQAAGVVARSLAHELTEVAAELEQHLGSDVQVLLGALGMRSAALATRARRVGRSVHQLAIAVHLDDVATHLGSAAACHEVGALALSDPDIEAVVVGESSAAERCALASELLLADHHPLAAAAARFRAPSTSFDRRSEQLIAQLTAVCHTFHAAAQHADYDAARGVAAVRADRGHGLDRDLVDAFLDACAPTSHPPE